MACLFQVNQWCRHWLVLKQQAVMIGTAQARNRSVVSRWTAKLAENCFGLIRQSGRAPQPVNAKVRELAIIDFKIFQYISMYFNGFQCKIDILSWELQWNAKNSLNPPLSVPLMRWCQARKECELALGTSDFVAIRWSLILLIDERTRKKKSNQMESEQTTCRSHTHLEEYVIIYHYTSTPLLA